MNTYIVRRNASQYQDDDQNIYFSDPYCPLFRLPFLEMSDDLWEEAYKVFGNECIYQDDIPLSEWLVRLNLCESKTQAKALIQGKAIKLNGVLKDEDYCLTMDDPVRKKWIFIHKGKKHTGGIITGLLWKSR